MKRSITTRGFGKFEFTDTYNAGCTIQMSSLATEEAIWFGVDDAEPRIMASAVRKGLTGWVDYPVPDAVSFNTRMHLTREQVKELLPILIKFSETGEL